MAEPSRDSIVVTTIGLLATAAIGATIGWLAGELTGGVGPSLTFLLASAGGVSGLVFALMYRRYISVLGAGGGTRGYSARDAYDGLRASLTGRNLASRLYAHWLAAFLDGVDRFFGDAGMTGRPLFPHAFGLKTPAPLWTAPAFDRCLLLALIYPIAAIFVIWAVSGHLGPAETPLRLQAYAAGRLKLIGFSVFSSDHSLKSIMWQVAVTAGLVAGPLAGAVAIAYAIAYAVAFGRAGAIAIAIAIAGAGAFAVAFADAGAGAGAFVAAFAVAFPGTVTILNDIAVQNQRQGIFLSLFLFTTIIVCLSAATLLSHFETWVLIGPLLLFLGLLTLLKAPFDWAFAGLTRALLRRALELGGWWFCFLALADALAATIIIALLAITMVIGVQTFDHLAQHSGGVNAPVLPLDKLFDGMAKQPSAPEYWWVYALPLFTMIPSLLTLMIGGASLLRGIPGLPALLLRFMPVSRALPAFDRMWLALVLTCQVYLGAFLGIAAQLVLTVGVIFYLLPWMGLELLDTARAVADFDLPMRVLRLWWGT
jgi:hypothetical protein